MTRFLTHEKWVFLFLPTDACMMFLLADLQEQTRCSQNSMHDKAIACGIIGEVM